MEKIFSILAVDNEFNVTLFVIENMVKYEIQSVKIEL